MVDRRNDWLRPMTLVAVSAAMLIVYGAIDVANPAFATWDLHVYRAMASVSPALSPNIPGPFAFRLLGPWLAGLLPVNVDQGFLFLTLMLGFSLPLLLDKWLRDRGVAPGLALAVTLFFVFNKHVYGFQIWNFYQLDDLIGMIAILLSIMALERGNLRAFSIILVIGVFAKETVLFAAIAALFVPRRESEKSVPLRSIVLAAAPAFVIYLGLHLLLPHHGGRGLIEAFLLHIHKLWNPEQLFRALANAYAPLSALFFIFPKELMTAIKKAPHLGVIFAGTYASTLLGLDGERLMAPAFVAVVGLTADIFKVDRRIRRLLPVFLVLAAINGFQDVITHQLPFLKGILGAVVFLVALAAAIGSRFLPVSKPKEN